MQEDPKRSPPPRSFLCPFGAMHAFSQLSARVHRGSTGVLDALCPPIRLHVRSSIDSVLVVCTFRQRAGSHPDFAFGAIFRGSLWSLHGSPCCSIKPRAGFTHIPPLAEYAGVSVLWSLPVVPKKYFKPVPTAPLPVCAPQNIASGRFSGHTRNISTFINSDSIDVQQIL